MSYKGKAAGKPAPDPMANATPDEWRRLYFTLVARPPSGSPLWALKASPRGRVYSDAESLALARKWFAERKGSP